MPRIAYSDRGDTPFQRLLGHNETILTEWTRLEETFYSAGTLDRNLKEQVRRTLAFGNGCAYCQAKGRADTNQEDMRTSLAVGFAELFLKDRGAIGEASFNILRELFTEQEIAELCAYICFTTGSQLFGAMMDLKPEGPAGSEGA